ncbi:hypothetical protein AHF37_10398, partial [Paragonimus kellicotti]
MQKASKLLHTDASYDDLTGPETERPGLSQNHRTLSFERPPSATKDKLPERLEAVERKVNRIVQLESDLQRQCLQNDASRVTATDQRAQMLQKASKLLHTDASYDDLTGPETERPGLSQNHRTLSFERPPSATKDKLPERLEAVERKVNRIVQLESDLQRQCLQNDASRVTATDQRAQMLVELQ